MNKVFFGIHDRNIEHVTGQKSVRLMADHIYDIEIEIQNMICTHSILSECFTIAKTSFNCIEEKFEAISLRKALISDSLIKILLCDWPDMANESVSEQNWTSIQLNLV